VSAKALDPNHLTDADLAFATAMSLKGVRSTATRIMRLELGNIMLDLAESTMRIRSSRFPLTSRELRRLATSFDLDTIVPIGDLRKIRAGLLDQVRDPMWTKDGDRLEDWLLGMTVLALVVEGPLSRTDILEILPVVRTDGVDVHLGPKYAPLVLRLPPLARVYVQALLLRRHASSERTMASAPPWPLLSVRHQLASLDWIDRLVNEMLRRLCRTVGVPVPVLDELSAGARVLLLEHYPAFIVALLAGDIVCEPPLAPGARRPSRASYPRRRERSGIWGQLHKLVLEIRPSPSQRARIRLIKEFERLADRSVAGAVAAMVTSLLRQGRPLNTVRTYGLAAIQLLSVAETENAGDPAAGSEAVTGWIVSAKEDTRRVYRAALAHARQHLRARGIDLPLPVIHKGVRTPQGVRLIGHADLERLLQFLPGSLPASDVREMKLLILLGRGLGMRISEILSLRDYHLALSEGFTEIVVGISKSAAGRRRRLPLDFVEPRLRDALMAELGDSAGRSSPNRLIDLKWQRRHGWREGLSAELIRLSRQAGLPHTAHHDLRHTAASSFVLKHLGPSALGHNPRALRRLEQIGRVAGLTGNQIPSRQGVRWGFPEAAVFLGHAYVNTTVTIYSNSLPYVQQAVTDTLPTPQITVPASAAQIWLARSRAQVYRNWGRIGSMSRLLALQTKLLRGPRNQPAS
jgi:integrase